MQEKTGQDEVTNPWGCLSGSWRKGGVWVREAQCWGDPISPAFTSPAHSQSGPPAGILMTPGRTPIGCRVSREANQRHRAPRLQYFLWTPGDSASSQNMWMAVSHPRTLFLLLLSGALTLTETSAGECGVGREISAAWEEGEGFRTHPSAAPPPGT